MSVDLVRMDWGYGVPTIQGTFNGKNLDNLSLIAKDALSANPDIQKKCWKFATHQTDGKSTYAAGQILAERINSSEMKVTFKDNDEQMIEKFKILALKKDFPNFDTSKLKNISFDEFKNLLVFLYSDVGEEHKAPFADRMIQVMDNLGIDDVLISIKYKNELPNAHNNDRRLLDLIKNCPSTQLPRILESLIAYTRNNTEENSLTLDLAHRKTLEWLLSEIKNRIDFLKPNNRTDVMASAELYRMLKKENFEVEIPIEYDDGATANWKFNFLETNRKQLEEGEDLIIDLSKESSFLSKVMQFVASFLSASLVNLFSTDKEFILNVLKSLPDLKIEIRHDIPKTLIDELAKFDNLEKISVSSDVSQECKALMREKNFKNYEEIPDMGWEAFKRRH